MVAGFEVRGRTLGVQAGLMAELAAAVKVALAAELDLKARDAALKAVFRDFKTMNGAVAARLESELEPGDGLRGDLARMRGVRPNNREKIQRRTLMTIECWQSMNERRAAETPARPALVVRKMEWAEYEARWKALPGLRMAREDAALAWRTAKAELAAASKTLGGLNVDWYQAWKSEYPPGTPEQAALAGVTRFPTGAKRKPREVVAEAVADSNE